MTIHKQWSIVVILFSFMLVIGCASKLSVPANKRSQQSIRVYVANGTLTALKTYNQTIPFANDEEKYKATLTALQTSPSMQDIPLWKNIEFTSIRMNKGNLVIDVHLPGNGHLGAGGEQFALEALTKTLFQYEEVNTINLLVDGQAVESLMGHVKLEHPIQRH